MAEQLKALSIRPNWAWLILHAGKDVENRKWATSHRGPMLIHAGKGLTRAEYDDLCDICDEDGITRPERQDVPQGGIVGRCRVTSMIEKGDPGSESIWFGGRYGWVLEDVEELPFVPLVGKLKLFNVDPGLIGKGAQRGVRRRATAR